VRGGRVIWKLLYYGRKGNMDVSLLWEEEGLNLEESLRSVGGGRVIWN
jgi:hypothetical protein